MHRTLPLGTPPLTTFLFQLYPLSVLAQEEAYRPWLYSTHLQLFIYPGEELKVLAHALSTSHRLSDALQLGCPLLDVQGLEQEALLSLAADPAGALARLLGMGLYVQVDLDHFHLPYRAEYRQRHFLHEVLLFGWDEKAGAFDALGYDRQGRLGTVCLHRDDLTRALQTPRAELVRAVAAEGPAPPWLEEAFSDRPRLFLYRYLPGRACSLNLPGIIAQMEDYLAARSTCARWGLGDRPRGIWGIAVYGYLRDLLAAMAAGQATSPIPWRLLWEHKRCMHLRLRFLEERGYLPAAAGLSDACARVEAASADLRLVALRWSARPQSHCLSQATALLDRIAAEEYRALEMVLGHLRAAQARAPDYPGGPQGAAG
ncbi:MAG: hypothetical protein AB1505_14515 [Candidatus Latescibacterota bacterium]